jgi:hypothetical protein
MIPSNELRIGNYVIAEQTLQRFSMLDNTSFATTAVAFNQKEKEAETIT